MGNNRKTGSDILRQPQAFPIERDYVAEVQQRAKQLAETAADSAAQTDRSGSRLQYGHVQEEMARLRSQAIQARRLEEQIEMVSLKNQPSQGTQDMVQTSQQDSETSRRTEKSTGQNAPAKGKRTAFNPLHPSMELPPEHLIRLLGLETKKTRKKPARQAPKRTQTPVPRSASGTDAELAPQLPPPIRPQRSRAAAAQTRAKKSRSSLLLPAIGVGVLAGVAASGYFFWYQDSPVVATEPTASAVSAPERKPPRPDELATLRAGPTSKPGLPEAVPSEPAAKPATPTAAGTVHRTAPPASLASGAKDATWRAAAEAERQRLRTEAEQRFAERLRQDGAGPAPTAAGPARVGANPAPAQPEYPSDAKPETAPNPPPQEVQAAGEPQASVAGDPEPVADPPQSEVAPTQEPEPRIMGEESVPSPAAHEFEPGTDAPFAAQPHSDAITPTPASEQPAEPRIDIPTDNSPVMVQDPGTAEAPQSPPRPAGAGAGVEPLPDPTRDTPLVSPQSAAEPAAPWPKEHNPEARATEPLLASPAPPADRPNKQDVEAAAATLPAGKPDERGAASGEPALF